MSAQAPSLVPPDMDAILGRVALSLPDYMRDGFLQYLRVGRPPGHFLHAVLSNDLAEACNRGDETNLLALSTYVVILTNYAPSDAWGSPEKVRLWIERARAVRQASVDSQAVQS